MKRVNILIALTLAGALATGCLKEDYSFCPPGVWVTFEAANPKHEYPELVQNLSLYLYDNETGALIDSWDYSRDELRTDDRAALVPYTVPGTYRLLAIVNDGIYTTTTGHERLSTIRSTVNGETLAYDAEPFMSAERTITIGAAPATRAADIEEHRMVLAKHNNNVFLHLTYETYAPLDGTNLTAWIEAPNRAFDHGAYTCPAGQRLTSDNWNRVDNIEHDPEHRYPYHPAEFAFSTMRLWHGSGVTLYVEEVLEPGSEVDAAELRRITFDVTELLREYVEPETLERIYDTDEELEYHDEYHITIMLGLRDAGLIVGDGLVLTVRKWDYIKDDIEL